MPTARSSRPPTLRPGRAAIEALLPEFTGEIMQRPPAFSAIKIAGERAYDLAREGDAVELEERPVAIHRLALVDVPDADHAVFEAECGKGTYVRALARDIGPHASAASAMSPRSAASRSARSTRPTSITLEALIEAREDGGAETLDRFLQPIGVALAGLPEIAIQRGDVGRASAAASRCSSAAATRRSSGVAHATSGGETIAIGEIAEGEFHPTRVFLR